PRPHRRSSATQRDRERPGLSELHAHAHLAGRARCGGRDEPEGSKLVELVSDPDTDRQVVGLVLRSGTYKLVELVSDPATATSSARAGSVHCRARTRD